MITAGSQHLKKVELGEGEQFAAGAHCSARGKLARPIEEEAAGVVHLLLVLLLLLRCHCRPPRTPLRCAQLHRKHSAQYASFIINVASLCSITFTSSVHGHLPLASCQSDSHSILLRLSDLVRLYLY